MDSIMSNAALKKSLLLYSQFASQHDALAERISRKVGAGAMSVPEFQNFHHEYLSIRKKQLECVSHAGGYVANVMAEQQIRLKNEASNVEKLTMLVKDLQNTLDQRFPLATQISVSHVDDKLSLVLVTNHTLMTKVIECINTNKVFAGLFAEDQFDPIDGDHQFVCGLNTEAGRQSFLKICQDGYDNARASNINGDYYDPFSPAM